MKKLLLTVIVLIVLLGTIGGGVYFYGSSKEADLVLEKNITELLSLENIERVEIKETSEGSIAYDIEFLEDLGQKIPTQDMDKDSTTIINVEDEEVEQDNETIDLEDYKKTSLLFEESLWEKVKDEKGYEITSVENDGNDYWEYQIDEDIIKEAFIDNLQGNFMASFEDEDAAMKIVDLEFDDSKFDGLTMKLLISKEDNTLAGYSFEVEGDLIFNIEFGGKQIDQLKEEANITDTTGVITFKNVSSESEVESIDFVEGEEIPTDIFKLLKDKFI